MLGGPESARNALHIGGAATDRSLVDRLNRDPNGPETIREADKLALKAVRRVARNGKLPPPTSTTWNLEAHQDLVNELWANDAIFKSAAKAGSDDQLLAALTTAAHNLVIDALRREDDRKIYERVQDVLRDPPFLEDRDAFGLPGFDPDHRYQGSERELRHVADLERLPLMYERSDAKKASPFARRTDLARVLTNVLKHAAAFVMLNTLVSVIQARLNRSQSFMHLEWELDSSERIDPADSRADAQTGADPRITELARTIWAPLSKHGKKAVAYITLSAREAAKKMAVKSPTTASNAQKEASERIEEQLDGEDDETKTAVLAELLRVHAQHWTPPEDPPLNASEDH